MIASVSAALDRAGIPFETDSAEHFFAGNYFNRFVTTLQILADVDKAKLYECWQDLIDGSIFNMGFKFLRSCARGGNLPLSEIIRGFCEKIAFLNDTADGVVRDPSAFVITCASPPSKIDTQLFVVPKSIPIILLIYIHLSF